MYIKLNKKTGQYKVVQKTFRLRRFSFVIVFLIAVISSLAAPQEVQNSITGQPLPVSRINLLEKDLKRDFDYSKTIFKINGIAYYLYQNYKHVTYDSALEIATTVINAEDKYDIDYTIMLGLITVESHFNHNAVNEKSGAMGLSQILPEYWVDELKSVGIIHHEKDLLKPKNNILGGYFILSQYMKQKNGDLAKALYKYGGFSKRTEDKFKAYYNKVIKGSKNFQAIEDALFANI